MARGVACVVWTVLVWVAAAGVCPAAPQGDPVQELAAARRLACAFTHGVQAGFTPKGAVSIKPPLNPNTPGLTIDIVDRKAGKVVLEEDDLETTGVFMITPQGLTAMVRYPNGGVTVVTVYPLYSGASDNFLMVSSHHGAATMPQMSQRYGLCRIASDAPPPPPAAPSATKDHGAHKP